MAGEQMTVRRMSGTPVGPPAIGKNELIIDEVSGKTLYRSSNGQVARLFPYPFDVFLVSAFQTGTGAPVGTIAVNELVGSGTPPNTPTWEREDVGEYLLMFPNGDSLNEDLAICFAQLGAYVGAASIKVSAEDTEVLRVQSFDAAGAAVDVQGAFVVLILNVG